MRGFRFYVNESMRILSRKVTLFSPQQFRVTKFSGNLQVFIIPLDLFTPQEFMVERFNARIKFIHYPFDFEVLPMIR